MTLGDLLRWLLRIRLSTIGCGALGYAVGWLLVRAGHMRRCMRCRRWRYYWAKSPRGEPCCKACWPKMDEAFRDQRSVDALVGGRTR